MKKRKFIETKSLAAEGYVLPTISHKRKIQIANRLLVMMGYPYLKVGETL